MRRFVNFLLMALALAIACLGGALLAGALSGKSAEFTLSLAVFLLAASQLLLLAMFRR